MPPFNQNPSVVPAQEPSKNIEKEKFNIRSFDHSRYTRIEDMPEEARGYFMSVPKHEGGGFIPNEKFRVMKMELEYEQNEFENERHHLIYDFTMHAWENDGRTQALAPSGYVTEELLDEYNIQMEYKNTTLEHYSISQEDLDKITEIVKQESVENLKKALVEWRAYFSSHEFTGNEIGFTYRDSYGINFHNRPSSDDKDYKPHWSSTSEINLLPTAEERYRAYLKSEEEKPCFSGVEIKLDDKNRFRTSYQSGDANRGKQYVGGLEIGGYGGKNSENIRYYLSTPTSRRKTPYGFVFESLPVIKSSYEEYLQSMDAILSELDK